jgi:hypothetical protein
MARKPNYQFERRERDRLKAAKNAEKAAAKKEAKERAKAKAGTPAPGKVDFEGKQLNSDPSYVRGAREGCG